MIHYENQFPAPSIMGEERLNKYLDIMCIGHREVFLYQSLVRLFP